MFQALDLIFLHYRSVPCIQHQGKLWKYCNNYFPIIWFDSCVNLAPYYESNTWHEATMHWQVHVMPFDRERSTMIEMTTHHPELNQWRHHRHHRRLHFCSHKQWSFSDREMKKLPPLKKIDHLNFGAGKKQFLFCSLSRILVWLEFSYLKGEQ